MDIQQIDTERILDKPNSGLDEEHWLKYLDTLDMDDNRKIECVTTVWNAMWAFASLAFQISPIQQVGVDCGQNSITRENEPSKDQDLVQ